VDIYTIEAVIKIIFKMLEFKKLILNDKKTLFTVLILFKKIIVNSIIPWDRIDITL
jgi:hypothetical protein